MAERNYYDESEAEEILRLASRRENPLGGVSRAELQRSAAELGISEEALVAAEQQFAESRREAEDRKLFDRHQWSEFLSHLGTYLVVCGGLTLFDFQKDGRVSWAYWPAGVWGCFIVISLIQGVLGIGQEREFARWRRKKRLREAQPERFDLHEDIEDIAEQFDLHEDRIQAIKALRQRRGIDLKDAREAIDDFIRVNG